MKNGNNVYSAEFCTIFSLLATFHIISISVFPTTVHILIKVSGPRLKVSSQFSSFIIAFLKTVLA